MERKENITVLLVKPGETPQVVSIENTLEAKQEVVGGWIECLNIGYENERNIDIVCNEEGKINGLELNRAVRDEDGKPYDIIAGDFLIVAFNNEGEAVSLTEDEISEYTEMFQYPEMFIPSSKGITVITLPKEDIRNA